MAEGTWFKSMAWFGKFAIVLIIGIVIINVIIKWLEKGEDIMKIIFSSILEVLKSIAISLVSGSTLSLR